MNLEDIKKWRNKRYVNMENLSTIKNIDWLIAELEKAQPVIDVAVKWTNCDIKECCCHLEIIEAVRKMEEL